MAIAAPALTFSLAHAPSWGDVDLGPPQVHTAPARDTNEHAHKLAGWQPHHDQLGAGRFEGDLTERHLPQMQVFREGTSQALGQPCRVWSDALWFGMPDTSVAGRADDDRSATRINARLQDAADIMTQPGDEDFELVTPEAHSLQDVGVRQQALADAAAREGCHVDWA